MKRPFLLHKRGKIWYVRLEGQKTFHSTGLTSKKDAETYARREVGKVFADGADDQSNRPVSLPSTDNLEQRNTV